jgi:hypothetical protein
MIARLLESGSKADEPMKKISKELEVESSSQEKPKRKKKLARLLMRLSTKQSIPRSSLQSQQCLPESENDSSKK